MEILYDKLREYRGEEYYASLQEYIGLIVYSEQYFKTPTAGHFLYNTHGKIEIKLNPLYARQFYKWLKLRSIN